MNSIKSMLLFVIFLIPIITYSQVGIGTSTPESSSILEIYSTDKGFLPTRLNQNQRNQIDSPANGLVIYNTDINALEFFNGIGWVSATYDGNLEPDAAFIEDLKCDEATHNGVIIVGNMIAQVSTILPYSGGNGQTYNNKIIPSKGVSGITATINGGTVANGDGTLNIVFTGTPANSGIAYFDINIAGQLCRIQRKVIPSCTVSGPGGTKRTFMCHNLGADITLDPHIPVKGIFGDYYQWGSKTPSATSDDVPTAITWNNTLNLNGSWNSASNLFPVKTQNDPCPTGFRIPSQNEYTEIIGNNTFSRTGTWVNNNSDFGSAIHFTAGGIKVLTFPANGYRGGTNSGVLYGRSLYGYYWTSTEAATGVVNSIFYMIGSAQNSANSGNDRRTGMSVKCIKE